MIFSASDCALEVFSLKSDILGCKQGQGHTAQFLTWKCLPVKPVCPLLEALLSND